LIRGKRFNQYVLGITALMDIRQMWANRNFGVLLKEGGCKLLKIGALISAME